MKIDREVLIEALRRTLERWPEKFSDYTCLAITENIREVLREADPTGRLAPEYIHATHELSCALWRDVMGGSNNCNSPREAVDVWLATNGSVINRDDANAMRLLGIALDGVAAEAHEVRVLMLAMYLTLAESGDLYSHFLDRP